MKNRILIFAGACCVVTAVVIATSFVLSPAEAQRAVSTRFEYAVINGSYSPYPADGPSVVTAAVNICYLQSVGCQNEAIKAEIVIGKFLQDERIENNANARALAQERAIEQGFSKAISKLGSEGWEIVTSPAIEFDLYYLNQQGIQTVKEGNRTERQHIWFKRAKQ
jgi:hypothetical protein